MTYLKLKTIIAEVVMFGIKLKLMKCRFELTYFYDPVTYCYDPVTYFYDPVTYLMTIRAKVAMFVIKLKLMKCIYNTLLQEARRVVYSHTKIQEE
jgi:hypothetical protein